MDMLIDLAENMIGHGFRRIVFINGHGGNIVPGAASHVRDCGKMPRPRSDLFLLSADLLDARRQAARGGPDDPAAAVGHACEWETSMMLRIAPQLVGDLPTVAGGPLRRRLRAAHRAWITKDRTEPGHIGNPGIATARRRGRRSSGSSPPTSSRSSSG